MENTYDLSWSTDDFFSKLRLIRLSRAKVRESRKSSTENLADAYSGLSSTYYSICGSAFAQAKKAKENGFICLLKWFFTWFPLGLWCYHFMYSASNKTVDLIGLKGMTAEQCDIRQSILGKFCKWNEVVDIIIDSLGKDMKDHTRGLLMVSLSEALWKRGSSNSIEVHLRLALNIAFSVRESEPLQAVRIFRKSADVLDLICGCETEESLEMRNIARKIAEEYGAKDQVLKV